MRSQTLQVPYKVCIPKKMNDRINQILLDEDNIKGWCGVAMGYRYGKQFDSIFADGIQKNPKINPDEEEIPEDYEYDLSKMVFLVDERLEINRFISPNYCAFSERRGLLSIFCKDFDIDPNNIVRLSMVRQVI